ncbi:hypothetical protein OG21DRAFT_1515350 [Imleria badia]|nr:hypothetical protein OG21DRAFT_1515350 [Imleria badia]
MTNIVNPQAPGPSQSFASASQTVDVVVSSPRSTNVSAIHLKDLPLPLKFDDVARKLIQAGWCRKFRQVCIC